MRSHLNLHFVLAVETQFEGNRPEHPGKMLRRLLDERGWSQDELADVIGCRRQTVSAIVAGKSGVTADMAVSLGTAFGNDPAEWLRLDSAYQLSLVNTDKADIGLRAKMYQMAPIRDMQKRGWIDGTDDVIALRGELERFFGCSIEEGINFPIAPRKSDPLAAMSAAERAWVFKAKEMAGNFPLAAEFFPDKLHSAEKKIRQLAAFPKEVRHLSQMLAYYGIRFVIIEPLPGARIDGAAFWLDEYSPVIAISARWDRIDAFWFTVIHEFMHIKNGDASFDVNLLEESDNGVVAVVSSDDECERQANQLAAELLVPQDQLAEFIKRVSPLYAATRIIQFAHRIRMHPGIIVGQLQHRGELRYSAHRDLLVKIRTMATNTALTDGWGHTMSPSA
jgi:HTH-type transcriptional regulator/antitoxin HigA